jgi:hypothetical protein
MHHLPPDAIASLSLFALSAMGILTWLCIA